MKIGIANDHAATPMKNTIMAYLQEEGYEVVNFGTNSLEKFDYPVAAETLANAVAAGEVEFGIAICGTGIGISIACNKVRGIRACVCSDTTSAKLTRLHNNANIICFGARVIGEELAKDIVDTFLETPFTHDERHQRRIDMITDIENRQYNK